LTFLLPCFNRLLLRNSDGSDFWKGYLEELIDINERIERWSRNYYLASEQLSTVWKVYPELCVNSKSM